jgi:hypothetical protein
MPNFIARVELHSASYADYASLHIYMQHNGYLRIIRADAGKTYQLPTGTYVSAKTVSSVSVALQSAVAAANSTGKNSSVVVAEWSSATWHGLPTVGAAQTA